MKGVLRFVVVVAAFWVVGVPAEFLMEHTGDNGLLFLVSFLGGVGG